MVNGCFRCITKNYSRNYCLIVQNFYLKYPSKIKIKENRKGKSLAFKIWEKNDALTCFSVTWYDTPPKHFHNIHKGSVFTKAFVYGEMSSYFMDLYQISFQDNKWCIFVFN